MGRRPVDERCSFCGKTRIQVDRLVAGPGVFICSQCIALCVEVINEGPPAPASPDPGGSIAGERRRRWFGRLFHSEALQAN